MKSMLSVLPILLLPAFAFAEIEKSTSEHLRYTLRNESCQRDLKKLAIDLCEVADPESLKEVYKDSFYMHTQAENSLEERIVFANWWGVIQVRRFTDYNEAAEYDRNSDYCSIQVTCRNKLF